MASFNNIQNGEENLKRLVQETRQKTVNQISEFATEAFSAINLQMVSNLKEIQAKNNQSNQKVFNPEYTHQIFGDDEVIYGYQNLQIGIYFSSGTLRPYINIEYTEKKDDADDIMIKFDEWFLGGYLTDYRLFSDELKQENYFTPLGKQIHQYEHCKEKYVVFKSSLQCDGFVDFRQSVWPLLLFSIETASFDENHDSWIYYSLYKQSKEDKTFSFVGVVTVTVFNLMINKQRNRISQALILKPYQRTGHGQFLVAAAYRDMIFNQPDCLQITVEDSSAEFQYIRDVVEAQFVIEGNFFSWANSLKSGSIEDVNHLSMISLRQEEKEQIKLKLKLPSFQIVRIFEIILLSKVDVRKQALFDKYKQIVIERFKKENEPGKRKIPSLNFNGEIVKIDVDLITDIQNKQMQQEVYYEQLLEYTLQAYKIVMKKLNLLQI